MRPLIAALLSASIFFASPASAASLGGMGKAIFGNTFNFGKANLPAAPVKAIQVGKQKVTFGATRLKDIQKAFGGTLQREGEDGSRADWLCYGTEDGTVWFIANALGGFEFVMMVAVEAGKPAKACDAAPAALTMPDFGIPGLGAPLAELKEKFGAASGNKIAYRADRAGGYADIAQYVGYMLKGGKVVALGVGETSVPTPH